MNARRGYSGKYKKGDRVTTTVVSWTAGVSPQKQTPFIRVTLEGGITWTGWTGSEKSREITIKALEVMGFKGTDLGQIKMDNALDTERDIVAVIGEVRKWKEKTYYDAAFINRASKKGFKADKNEGDVFDTLSGIDTKSQIEDSKDLSQTEEKEVIGHHPVFDQTFTADDIPF